jgi:hypothetical protein
MLLAIVVGIKLYDLKRRREAEVLSLQSLVSEALLLLEPSLTRLPIAAFARGSLWRHSSVVVAVTGPVPTPEVRMQSCDWLSGSCPVVSLARGPRIGWWSTR